MRVRANEWGDVYNYVYVRVVCILTFKLNCLSSFILYEAMRKHELQQLMTNKTIALPDLLLCVQNDHTVMSK